jgi:hypothetical protein
MSKCLQLHTFGKRHWIPAWPFLETSPFGLVFAGTTIKGIRLSCTFAMLNNSELVSRSARPDNTERFHIDHA